MISQQTILNSSTFAARPNKIQLLNFSIKELKNIAESLRGKIVEIVMKDNNNNNKISINNMIDFIKKEGANWIGIEMNFLYLQQAMTSVQLKKLADSLKNLQNLETLILSFGGLRVSLLHALNCQSSTDELTKALPAKVFETDSLKAIIQAIAAALKKNSKTLRIFGFDFIRQTQIIPALPELTKMNKELAACSQLEVYEFSMNHVLMKNENQVINDFFESFEQLKGKTKLKVFTLNICNWYLEINHYFQLAKIFGDLLGENTPCLEKFSFDHSHYANHKQVEPCHIKGIIEGICKMVDSHRTTLKEFHVCFNSYTNQPGQLSQIPKLFSPLQFCQNLEVLTLRIFHWVAKNKEEQIKLVQDMLCLFNAKKLSFFHFQFNFETEDSIKTQIEEIIDYLQKINEVRMKSLSVQCMQEKIQFNRINYATDIVDTYLSKTISKSASQNYHCSA